MMMMPNEETLKKFVGDPANETPDAAYRLAASVFVETIAEKVIESIADDSVKKYLIKNKHIAEFVVGFVLAATLELFPLQGLDDQRKRLSYNLRVRSYEELGELGLSFISAEVLLPLIKLIREEADEFFSSVKGKEEGKVEVEVEVEVEGEGEDEEYPPESAARMDPVYRHIQDTAHLHKHEHGSGYHYHQHRHSGGEVQHAHRLNYPMLERSREHQAKYHAFE